MQPIYEQIVEQIKKLIIKQELKQDEMLPSVRGLARELKVSALTVKKAYDFLEREGFIVTVHGKGSFVSTVNQNLIFEEVRKEVEGELERAIHKGRTCGMQDIEIREMFDLLMEDETCY